MNVEKLFCQQIPGYDYWCERKQLICDMYLWTMGQILNDWISDVCVFWLLFQMIPLCGVTVCSFIVV